MPKSYEELMGPLGRSVFFRPERKRVRDLLSADTEPHLLVGGHEYKLFDISMNGLSFLAPDGAQAWLVGKDLELTLRVFGAPVYSGHARIARVEPGSRSGVRVGVGLTTGFLDLPEMIRQNEEGRLERELTVGAEEVRKKVPQAFWKVVSDASYFLQYHKCALDRHEARYRAAGATGDNDVAALAHRALDALREPWNEIQRAASVAAFECLSDREVLLAAKDLTETLVTPVMLHCPLHRRAYLKPLGYAGDYQVMVFYYNNALEGDSVFAQVFHKFGTEHPLSAGVRTRKDFIVDVMGEELTRVVAVGGADSLFRVTSLGCGPAREVADFAKKWGHWPGCVHWTLIDQEDEALSVAYQTSRRALAQCEGQGTVQCLNFSFAQLFRDPTIVKAGLPQDFIFSTGLVDYLREATAQQLVAVLYDRLAPGGLLALGNAVGPNDYFFSAEFMLDWTIFYRTKEEMLRLAKAVAGEAQVKVALEPGKAYYFLLVRKPGQ